jgi:hypothetical protein
LKRVAFGITVTIGTEIGLINDKPWKRAYVMFKENTKVNLQANDVK